LLFAVTSLGNAMADNFTVFIAWRIFGGVAIGLASNLSPMYISEIAPAQLRGRLVAINQLTVVIGILLAQYINWFLVRNLPQGATDDFIRTSWFGQQGWRWMFGLTAAPSLLFFLGMLAVPESPRWLAKKGKSERARAILTRVGGKNYANAAVADIQSTLASEESQRVRFAELLEPKMRKVIILGVVIAVFQQWCGINVIFNYAPEIFHAAGYDISTVLKNIAWTGSVNLVFTLVALGVVDRGGRRPLMLFGSAALAVIYGIMGFCYKDGVQGLPMLLLVLAAIGCYAMSLAPVAWVVISEIFPNRIRGAAMAVAVSSLWIACFILTYTFPILNSGIGAIDSQFKERLVEIAPWLKTGLGTSGTFWLYGAICLAGFIFIFFKLPETKGKTLEEIERELVD
jgi:sugar porter (SP) family MFS transporter